VPDPVVQLAAKNGGLVRTALRAEAERRGQGDGDTALMKLSCAQLFNAGLDDVLLIWQAKEASWNTHNSPSTCNCSTGRWPEGDQGLPGGRRD
jgi:hypothetical protein